MKNLNRDESNTGDTDTLVREENTTDDTVPDTLPPKTVKWVQNWGYGSGRRNPALMRRQRSGSETDGTDPVTPPIVQRSGLKEKALLRRAVRDLSNFREEALAEQTRETEQEEQTAPDPVQERIDVLSRLLDENGKAQTKESSVFKGIDRPDALRDLPENTRDKTLKAVRDVFESIASRRTAFTEAIGAVDELNAVLNQDQTKIYQTALSTRAALDIHLPDGFTGLRPGELDRRIATLLLSDEDKKNQLDELKKGFVCEKVEIGGVLVREQQDLKPGDLGKRLTDVTKKYGLGRDDGAGDYFQRFLLSPRSSEDQKDVAEANEIIVDHCIKILDCGGTLTDVEDLMKKEGIPEVLWPPRLNSKVQAWRKLQREMQVHRLDEQAEELGFTTDRPPLKTDAFKPVKDGVDSVDGVRNFISNNFSSVSDLIDKVATNDKVSKALGSNLQKLGTSVSALSDIAQALEGPMKLLSLGLETEEVVKLGGFAKLQDDVDKGLQVISSLLSTVQGTIEAIDEIGPGLGKEIMNHVVPGLGVAVAGVDLVRTVATLIEDAKALRGIKQLGDEALQNVQDSDLGLVDSLSNAGDGKKRQIGSGVVDTVTGVLNVGSHGAKFGGPVGITVSTALTVVKGVISAGKTVVLAGIDWSRSKEARETLERARGGDPLAQQLVLKQCSFYAKMYLAILAKDGDPLATKYLIKEGIRENDLKKESISTKILADALMKSSKQVNEEEVPESLFDALTNNAIDTLEKKWSGLRDWRKQKSGSRDNQYDETWTHSGAAEVNEAHYRKVKDEAVIKGLRDDKTGIGAAVADAEKKLKATEGIDPKKQLSPTSKEGGEAKKTIQAARTALGTLANLINATTPMTNPLDKTGFPSEDGKPKFHKGMMLYLEALRDAATDHRRRLENLMIETGLQNPAYTVDMSDPLSAKKWRTAWKDGVDYAALPESDAGVGKALDALAEAEQGFEKAKDGDGPTRRKAVLAVNDAVIGVSRALDACANLIGYTPNLSQYMQQIRESAVLLGRRRNATISTETWTAKALTVDQVNAKSWKVLWDDAVSKGFADGKAGDGGVLDALTAWAKAEEVVAANAKKPAEYLKGVKQLRTAVGRLVEAARDFTVAQSLGAPQPLKGSIDAALRKGRLRAEELVLVVTGIKFDVDPEKTAKGWKATLGSAVSKGAVAGGDKNAAELAKNLTAYESAAKDLEKAINAKKFNDARSSAEKAKTAVQAAMETVGKLSGTADFKENAQMSQYLKGLATDLKGRLEVDPLKSALAGTAAPENSLVQPTEYKLAGLADMLKTARQLGIVPGTAKDTIEPLREYYIDICGRYAKARVDTKLADDIKESLKRKAVSAVGSVHGELKKMLKLSENKEWKTYITGQIDALIKRTQDQLDIKLSTAK